MVRGGLFQVLLAICVEGVVNEEREPAKREAFEFLLRELFKK